MRLEIIAPRLRAGLEWLLLGLACVAMLWPVARTYPPMRYAYASCVFVLCFWSFAIDYRAGLLSKTPRQIYQGLREGQVHPLLANKRGRYIMAVGMLVWMIVF